MLPPAGRDPRWGRNQETNGEAPLLLGDYGKAYTEGVQVGEDPRFYKAIVTVSRRALRRQQAVQC